MQQTSNSSVSQYPSQQLKTNANPQPSSRMVSQGGKTKTAKKSPKVASSNWLALKKSLPAGKKKPRAVESVKGHGETLGSSSVIVPTPGGCQPVSGEGKPTKYLALDCEFVGVGSTGKRNALARVSIVNELCQVVFDTYVKVPEKVTDWRTDVSGVRPHNLLDDDAIPLEEALERVSTLVAHRILVGHGIHNDLKVLMLPHSFKKIRDTARFPPFMRGPKKPKKLSELAEEYLKVRVQQGEHSSVEDAVACMKLYKLVESAWERSLHVHVVEKVATTEDSPTV